ncbi:unnamed protein product [Polarella glacialis]|uniref:Leucine-rich repeat-containing protein 51 n=1 Tax=Polarella glacialis TaxID=89957 RepID=A0A813FHD4_POLGL|nr:unnamed protein product [Polarella glacialis]
MAQPGEVVSPRERGELVAVGPPLDYSFKELRTCAEIETEEPRSGVKRPGVDQKDGTGSGDFIATDQVAIAAAGAKAAMTRSRMVIRKVIACIKLNNNCLQSVNGLGRSLELAMPSPVMNLQWLDISFNQIKTIEPEILTFVNLKALYLHGNLITRLAGVERLRKLPKLLSLTLNGNPVESTGIYRCFIIGALPTLKSLDHSTITEDEFLGASTWYQGHSRRAKKRREELDELAAMKAAMD